MSNGMNTLDAFFKVSCDLCTLQLSLGRIQREVKQQETDVIREGTHSDLTEGRGFSGSCTRLRR